MIQAVDANVLIYFLDDASPFFAVASSLLHRLAAQSDLVVMSAVGRTEILNYPYRLSAKQGELATKMLDDFDYISYEAVTLQIADAAAKLVGRIGGKLKNIDAIHLATALACGAREFYTNDKVLLGLSKIDALHVRPLA